MEKESSASDTLLGMIILCAGVFWVLVGATALFSEEWVVKLIGLFLIWFGSKLLPFFEKKEK